MRTNGEAVSLCTEVCRCMDTTMLYDVLFNSGYQVTHFVPDCSSKNSLLESASHHLSRYLDEKWPCRLVPLVELHDCSGGDGLALSRSMVTNFASMLYASTVCPPREDHFTWCSDFMISLSKASHQAGAKVHSRSITVFSSLLSTVVWTLKVRMNWLSGAKKQQTAMMWCKGLCSEHRWLLSRRDATDILKIHDAAISFTKLQLNAVGFGKTREKGLGLTAIYGIFSGQNSYVGRTAIERKGSPYTGSWHRYDEHNRALWREHCQREGPKSMRSRYKKLLYGVLAVSLCFVCYMLIDSGRAQVMETWVIQSTLPSANNLLWTPGVKERRGKTALMPARVPHLAFEQLRG